jgi:hypothetical protein
MRTALLFMIFFFLFITVNAQNKNRINKEDTVAGLDLADNLSYPYDDAIERIKLYKKHRYNRHRRAWPLGQRFDAGSCWFSMAKLDSFRHAINAQLKGGDCVSGFRFYYMVYTKDDDHAPNGLKDMKKVHSLLIVATHYVPVDGHLVHKDIIDAKGKIAATIVSPFQNEGTLCPPQKECGGAVIANAIYH